MRKYRLYIIILLLLIPIAFYFILQGNNGTIRKGASKFSISDTSGITSLEFYSLNDTLILDRQYGVWMVNNTYKARNYPISQLLNYLTKIRILTPVAKKYRDQLKQSIQEHSINICIYQKQKLIKSFYVCKDSIEGTTKAYIAKKQKGKLFEVYIPEQLGNVADLFVLREYFWRDNLVFNTSYQVIKSIEINYPQKPTESFTITNVKNKKIVINSILSTNEKEITDLKKVFHYFSLFTNLRYEIFADKENSKVDSILKTQATNIISLHTFSGKKLEIKTFKIPTKNKIDENGKQIDYDLNVLLALINNTDPVIIKYINIDPLLVTKEYFLNPN